MTRLSCSGQRNERIKLLWISLKHDKETKRQEWEVKSESIWPVNINNSHWTVRVSNISEQCLCLIWKVSIRTALLFWSNLENFTEDIKKKRFHFRRCLQIKPRCLSNMVLDQIWMRMLTWEFVCLLHNAYTRITVNVIIQWGIYSVIDGEIGTVIWWFNSCLGNWFEAKLETEWWSEKIGQEISMKCQDREIWIVQNSLECES